MKNNKIENYIRYRKKLDDIEEQQYDDKIYSVKEYFESKEKIKFLPLILMPFILFISYFIYQLGLNDFLELLNLNKEIFLTEDKIESLDHVPYLFSILTSIYLTIIYLVFRQIRIHNYLESKSFEYKMNDDDYSGFFFSFFIIILPIFFLITELFSAVKTIPSSDKYNTIFSIDVNVVILITTIFTAYYIVIFLYSFFKVRKINKQEQIDINKGLLKEEESLNKTIEDLERQITNSSSDMKEVLSLYLKDKDLSDYLRTLLNLMKEKNENIDKKNKEIQDLENIYSDVYNKKISLKKQSKVSIENE